MDPEVLHALGSPLRVELLSAISCEATSIHQLASLLDVKPNRVAYHMRVLEHSGLTTSHGSLYSARLRGLEVKARRASCHGQEHGETR